MITYCRHCLLPSTKPYIAFDQNGVCLACRNHQRKLSAEAGINWEKRKEEFKTLVGWAKEQKAPYFDALVPVSGGKDSITQVHYLREQGLRILAVNVDFGVKTPIGVRNLNLIPEMGANLSIFQPEAELHRHLIRLGFFDFGNPELLCHTLLHAYPLHLALAFDVPLALLGENSAFEYGGEPELANSSRISRAWFQKYAAAAGNDARVIAEKYNIPFDRLRLYDFPDEIENSTATQAVFTSYFFTWDSEQHLRIAQGYGFESLDSPFEGSYRNYVGIDEEMTRINHHLKFIKFGYGRATDHACEDIRSGRLEREAAKELVRKHDAMSISSGMVERFLAFTGIKKEEFYATLDHWRNPDIWRKDNHGRWFIPGWLEG
jgi:N-acetyl sugar amidotransferase